MKKKVSAFEYAISEAVGDTEFMKNHEPRTREEETEHRLNNIRNQAKKLRIADVVDSEAELPEGCQNPLGCACKEANGYPITDCNYWEG